MSRTSGRQIIYKLYDVDNVFIRVLDEVISDISVEKNIFSSSGPLTLQFSKKVDELPVDLTFNNKIKIYIRNKWNNEPQVVYYGYIVSIDPALDASSEQTGITCLSVCSKLKNDYLRITENDLAYEIAPSNIGNHIKVIIDHYRETINDRHGSYDRSMLDNTNTYWSDTDYIQDTTAIGTIPHRYFNLKHLDAVHEIGKFLPKNDSVSSYWYWWINDEGRFILKKLSSTADHVLTLGKHCTFSMRNNIESVINRVYFWNERGDYAGEQVRTKYEDTTSQDQYDVIADQMSDSNVSTYTQSRLLAEGSLMDRKDNEYQASVIVSESEYDILSFEPGHVVKIINTKDENLFSSRMIIEKIVLTKDTAVLSLSTPRPDLSTQVETDREFVDKQLKWFGDIMTRIDGSRIYSGVQHWLTEDIEFSSDSHNSISWTAGTFTLSNDVKRVITSGSLSGLSSDKNYYLFVDEENAWSTKDTAKAAEHSGTGNIADGENFLMDTSVDWESDQWKGYVLWVNPSGEDAKKYIIGRNTNTILHLEGHDTFRVTDASAPYEIHRLELRVSDTISEEGLADSGSTTTLVDSSRTEDDNHWNGYRMKIMSGANAGMIRQITSFSSNTLTFPALPFAIVNDIKYSLYLGTETQILINKVIPSPVEEGKATIKPENPAGHSDYIYEGATRAFTGIDEYVRFIKDVVNEKLDTSAETILADFDFGEADYAGALKSGSISWNTSTGSLDSLTGSGVAIYRRGLVGAHDGDVTFSIDATTGNAYFAGELGAETIFAGEIDAGQITSGVLNAARVRIGSGTTYDSNYDPTTKFPSASAGDLAYKNTIDNANLLQNEVISYAKLGTTIIDGGYLQTALIDADLIQAGILLGRTISTYTIGASHERVQLDASSHDISWYHTDGTLQGFIDTSEVTDPIGGDTISSFRIVGQKNGGFVYFALRDSGSTLRNPMWMSADWVYFNRKLRIPVGTDLY